VFNRLGVLGGALLLSACSLINSYDEVLPGDGGGSPTSSSTTSTSSGGGQGGGGATTTSSSSSTGGGGQGGEGGEGGGVTELPQLNCSATSKVLIQNTSTLTGTDRFYESVHAFRTSTGPTRVLAVRRNATSSGLRTLQIFSVAEDGTATVGGFANVSNVLDVGRVNSASGGGVGALIYVFTGTSTFEVQLMVWEDAKPLTDFPTQHVMLNLNTPLIEPRGRFVHLGPAANRIDFLLSQKNSLEKYDVRFYRKTSAANATGTLIVGDAPTASAGAPRALAVGGNPLVAHAFVGEPEVSGAVPPFTIGGLTRRHSFPEDSPAPVTPVDFGPTGSVAGLVRYEGTNVAVAGALLQTDLPELRARVLVPSQLGASTQVFNLLAPIGVFSSFAEFPRKPSPSFAPQSLLYPATVSDDEKLLFAIARIDTSGPLNGIRYANEDLAMLSSTTGKFTDALAAASGDAMGVDGGQAFVFFSERDSAAATAERLYQVRVQCTN
jgi:hypothetical protein